MGFLSKVDIKKNCELYGAPAFWETNQEQKETQRVTEIDEIFRLRIREFETVQIQLIPWPVSFVLCAEKKIEKRLNERNGAADCPLPIGLFPIHAQSHLLYSQPPPPVTGH